MPYFASKKKRQHLLSLETAATHTLRFLMYCSVSGRPYRVVILAPRLQSVDMMRRLDILDDGRGSASSSHVL